MPPAEKYALIFLGVILLLLLWPWGDDEAGRINEPYIKEDEDAHSPDQS